MKEQQTIIKHNPIHKTITNLNQIIEIAILYNYSNLISFK